jgi:hypothetical protein
MISFKTKAEGGVHAGDRTEIRRALSLLIAPGDRHELRALPSGACRIVSGDDLDSATDAADELCDQQVYWCLNPIRPDADRANKKTVLRRRWFLVDVDTIRPKDVSATEDEKAKCYETAASISFHLLDRGWPAPLIVDSGNGWHLLYRIELPNEPMSQQLLKAALYELGQKFDSEFAIVDRSTHDAPRISKLPGTLARKGPDTPDRPHRMSRITYEPDRLEVVTVDQIRDVGTPAKKATNGTHSGFETKATDDASKSAYVRAAIDRECQRVMIAPQGGRNHALNRAAFALGQFDGWPEMHAQEARHALLQAAQRAGLTEHEIRLTIESGWTAGVKEPRPRPVDPGKVNGHSAKPMPAKLTVGLHEIKPKKVDWLWESIAAPGFISLFAGRTGMGKSFVTCDFAARLSNGESPAFSSLKRPPCQTLFISEDPPEYMLGPRLMEMKADHQMIRFMTFEAMGQFKLDRLDVLEAAYMECGQPKLIVIDPPSNFLGKTDDHKNSELRGVLMGVVEWINRHDVACIMITHLNKAIGKGLDAVSRVMGSVAWVSTARIAIVFEQDPDNPTRFLMGGGKNNLGEKAGTYAYEIEKTNDLAVVKWIGPVDTSADDAVNKVKKKTRAMSAIEWLEDRFRERREWPSDELRTEALLFGLSKNALWEPEVQALPISKRQQTTMDGKRCWVWTAQHGWPAEKTDGNLGNVGICDPNSNDVNSHHTFPIPESVRESEANRDSEGQIPRFPDSQIPGGVKDGESGPPIARPEGWPGVWTYSDGKGKKGDVPY